MNEKHPDRNHVGHSTKLNNGGGPFMTPRLRSTAEIDGKKTKKVIIMLHTES